MLHFRNRNFCYISGGYITYRIMKRKIKNTLNYKPILNIEDPEPYTRDV